MLTYMWALLGKHCHITNSRGLDYHIPNRNGVTFLLEFIRHPGDRIPYQQLLTHGVCLDPDQEFKGRYPLSLSMYGMHEIDFYQPIPKNDLQTVREVAREILLLKERIALYRSYNDDGMADMLTDELEKLQTYFHREMRKDKVFSTFYLRDEQLREQVKKCVRRCLSTIQQEDRYLSAFFTRHLHLYGDYAILDPFEDVEFRIVEEGSG